MAKSLSLIIGHSKQEEATASSCLLVATSMIGALVEYAFENMILFYKVIRKDFAIQ